MPLQIQAKNAQEAIDCELGLSQSEESIVS